MKLSQITIRNFRRLQDVTIDVEEKETLFVGPNNSGKTSAGAIFRAFLGDRGFKIHDFSVARVADFAKFATDGDAVSLPRIELDLWFTIDPNTIAFGRVFTLLPKLSDFTKVGLRLSYGVEDAQKLRSLYNAAYPSVNGENPAQSLFQYLSIEGNLGRHSTVQYASLEIESHSDPTKTTILATPLDKDEGKRLLHHLIQVDFVDAQRNINDDEASRSNKLSAAFASFYRKNLEQASYAAEAHKIIDQNNDNLTAHYEVQFKPLFTLIKGLGVPSINDRQIRIISSLSPETALRGNTELLYVDPDREHNLPELYNGLGFKNLIYMAIQARHFHAQWLRTEEDRPLCMLLFIEEPEVHLHAQIQQTFIANIWKVISDSATEAGEPDAVPQLILSTHSSHILETIDFEKVRYFQRCYSTENTQNTGIRNVSTVKNLRAFQPEADPAEGITEKQALEFLKRYLRLTHCDLFFADAAILVEGAVEKLLMPVMIEKCAAALQSNYITTLEVGGAYAHRFEGLLTFIRIPYLIITDLDSVEPTGHHPVCRADFNGALTSNASLQKLSGKSTVAELMGLTPADKFDPQKDRYFTFQSDIETQATNTQLIMRPRTLEEALAFQNCTLLQTGAITIVTPLPATLPEIYEAVYRRVKSDKFKKTDFAMALLASTADWAVPAYISEGLLWLAGRLTQNTGPDTVAVVEVTSGVQPA